MSDTDARKPGWFRRLADGLSRSSRQMSDQVVSTFVKKPLDQAQLDALEDMLIEADLGPHAAGRITARFAEQRFGRESDEAEVKQALAEAIAAELLPRQGRFDALGGPRPYVVLFVGVNGSGKTTTLGKIAADLTGRGAKVLVVAGDTFRAAAVEQLKIWAERAGAGFISRPAGSDAAGLAFDAFERARIEGYDVVLIDTAVRLQNKTGLMDELLKIVRVLKKVDPDAPHETLLVLDATVGRNALAQENIFGNTAGVTGIVMTKLDGTARGGVLVPVAQASDAPIKLIGVGEGIEDLQDFDAMAFSRTLVGLGRGMTETPVKTTRTHGAIRMVVDYGGIAAFGLAYFLRLRFVAAAGPIGWTLAMGGHGPRDLTGATWWLMGGSVVSLLVGLVAEKRLAPMPLIAGLFALVFGGLTLFFHDPRFIKIKPTVVNVIFGAALIIGAMLGRNPLKWLLGEALTLPEEAWRKLIFRYAFYFLAMAALNEAVWRTQTDAVWVNFHVWGQWICVIAFSISQVPFMMKYMKTAEPPPPPTD